MLQAENLGVIRHQLSSLLFFFFFFFCFFFVLFCLFVYLFDIAHSQHGHNLDAYTEYQASLQ